MKVISLVVAFSLALLSPASAVTALEEPVPILCAMNWFGWFGVNIKTDYALTNSVAACEREGDLNGYYSGHPLIYIDSWDEIRYYCALDLSDCKDLR